MFFLPLSLSLSKFHVDLVLLSLSLSLPRSKVHWECGYTDAHTRRHCIFDQSYFQSDFCWDSSVVRLTLSDMPLPLERFQKQSDAKHFTCFKLCSRVHSLQTTKWLIRWHFSIWTRLLGFLVAFFSISAKQLVRWYFVAFCSFALARSLVRSKDLFSFIRHLMSLIFLLRGVSLLFAH